MSQPNEEWNKSLYTVVLCAGEGVRLQEITHSIPKPLIKIKALNNKPILQYTIDLLIRLGVKKICIVKGYLAKKIDQFIAGLKQEATDLDDILCVADATDGYKLGPLYSFLSITKNKKIYNKGYIYFIIPGDTIFHYNLLNEIISFIRNNFDFIQKNPLIFFRKIQAKSLKLQNQSKIVSLADVERQNLHFFLKRIKQLNLSKIANSETINQIIPIFLFPYYFIQKIIKIEKKISVKTVREGINYLIQEQKKILAIKIDNDYDFYDIDNKLDLIELNKKRGTIVNSEY